MNHYKIILVGGTGFVGKNIYKYLIKNNYSVYCPTSRELDIASLESCLLFFNNFCSCEYIINCAVYGGFRFETDKKKIKSVCFDGVKNLTFISELFNINLIHLGSSSQYGKPEKILRENELIDGKQISDYEVYKFLASQWLQKCKGINWVEFILFSVYGLGEHESRLFFNIFNSLKNNKEFVINNKNFVRDFIYIKDICKCIELYINGKIPKNERYNVCSGVQTSLENLLEIIEKNFPNMLQVNYKNQKEDSIEPKTWVGSNEKIKKYINFNFTTIEDATKEMYEEYDR